MNASLIFTERLQKMKWILMIPVLILAYVIWQRQELKKFTVTHYEVNSEKLKNPLTALVVSDFHCHNYGRKNERLVHAVKEVKPDLILVPGDMIVSAKTEEYPVAFDFFRELTQIAPVYFANGNHESRIDVEDSPYREAYESYKRKVQKLGVHFLNNRCEAVNCNENILTLYGVDIPLECYQKGKTVPLPEKYVKDTLGAVDAEHFSILLAHNPAYIEDYTGWGADVTVSGHTHGGLVRIPGVGSVISPQFKLFPKYDAGEFTVNGKKAFVSRGLGTHTFHIRIFDRAELMVLHLKNTNPSGMEK